MLDKNEEQRLNLLIIQAKSKCDEKYGVEITQELKIDASKTYEENKEAILTAIREEKDRKIKENASKPKPPVKATPVKMTTPKKSAEERRQENEQLTQIVREANKNIKCEDREITRYYEPLRNSVERLVKGFINSVFVCGRAGVGKTFQVIAELNEMGLEPNRDYVEFTGEMSPAFVYRFLFENNGKIIIFRDLTNLITTMRSLELLKSATETKEPRVIRKGNYSKNTEDMPTFFECKSKFIFEFNSLRYDGLKEDIEALLSRGDYVVVSLSFDDTASIMRKIAKEDWEKEVVEFLGRNYKFVGTSFNLRTQKKAFGIYKWCEGTGRDWREELSKYLKSEMSSIRRTLYTHIGDRVVKSSTLKKILVLGNIDGVNTLRSADRRIRDWILLNELFIVGGEGFDEEELENFLDTHRNYAVSLNSITIRVKQEATQEVGFEQPQEVLATQPTG